MNAKLYAFIMIMIIALVTAVLRFLPFIIFRGEKPVPKLISYLGTVLPGAIMAMLVVYCLKSVSFSKAVHWLPALISVVVTTMLHVWKRNTLFSIIGGTACYMLLLQLMI